MQTPPIPRILIVDDNAPYRHLVAAWLRMASYYVHDASDGEHALAELERQATAQAFDLILLDLQMEPLGGLTFMERLQETAFKTIPVVLITSDPSTDILLRATKLGFAGVMKKPVDRDRLLKMVTQQLDRSRQTISGSDKNTLTAI